jgi:hypothetical protein
MSDRHAFEIKWGAQGRARPAREKVVTGHIEAQRLRGMEAGNPIERVPVEVKELPCAEYEARAMRF